MREDANNELGEAIDQLDNYAHALKLPLRAEMHVEQMRVALPEVVKRLKAAFVEVTGENPWEFHP